MSQTITQTEYRDVLSRMDQVVAKVDELATLMREYFVAANANSLPDGIKPITKDDEWFWSEEWQKKEREADEAEARGDFVEFDNPKDAIAYLQS